MQPYSTTVVFSVSEPACGAFNLLDEPVRALCSGIGDFRVEEHLTAGHLLPRFEVMLDHVDLDAALADADLVLTAEGTIDEQTPRGKMPAEVARRAKRYGKPVIALAGTIGVHAQVNYDVGIDAFVGILPRPIGLEAALRRGAEFFTDATERVLRLSWLVPRSLRDQRGDRQGLRFSVGRVAPCSPLLT